MSFIFGTVTIFNRTVVVSLPLESFHWIDSNVPFDVVLWRGTSSAHQIEFGIANKSLISILRQRHRFAWMAVPMRRRGGGTVVVPWIWGGFANYIKLFNHFGGFYGGGEHIVVSLALFLVFNIWSVDISWVFNGMPYLNHCQPQKSIGGWTVCGQAE